MNPLLHIQTLNPQVTLISFEGPLTAKEAISLRAQVMSVNPKGHLILEMKSVSLLDSLGVAFLVSLKKAVNSHNRELFLSSIQEQPFMVLQLCQLDGVFRFVSSTQKALEWLANGN